MTIFSIHILVIQTAFLIFSLHAHHVHTICSCLCNSFFFTTLSYRSLSHSAYARLILSLYFLRQSEKHEVTWRHLSPACLLQSLTCGCFFLNYYYFCPDRSLQLCFSASDTVEKTVTIKINATFLVKLHVNYSNT